MEDGPGMDSAARLARMEALLAELAAQSAAQLAEQRRMRDMVGEAWDEAMPIGRAVMGNDLRLSAVIANLPLAAGAGLFGGFLGLWLQSRGAVPSIRRSATQTPAVGHPDEGTSAP